MDDSFTWARSVSFLSRVGHGEPFCHDPPRVRRFYSDASHPRLFGYSSAVIPIKWWFNGERRLDDQCTFPSLAHFAHRDDNINVARQSVANVAVSHVRLLLHGVAVRRHRILSATALPPRQILP